MAEREKKADEKYCQECGELIKLKAEICPKCGCRQPATLASTTVDRNFDTGSPKSRTTAGLLALFLGGMGMHKFYLGKSLQGLVYLLFCWAVIPIFLGIAEGIRYLLMSDAEFQARYLAGALDNIGGTFEPTPKTHIKCPDCREMIPKEARVCKYCGCRVVSQ